MSLKLVFSPRLVRSDINLCEAYWAYRQNGHYLEHIKTLCKHYAVDYHTLYAVLSECQAYLGDVNCEYCGRPYQPDVPADIPYIQKQSSWFCESCISFSGGQLVIGR